MIPMSILSPAARAIAEGLQRVTRFENDHPGIHDWWKNAERGTLAFTYRTLVAEGGQLTPAQLALVPKP